MAEERPFNRDSYFLVTKDPEEPAEDLRIPKWSLIRFLNDSSFEIVTRRCNDPEQIDKERNEGKWEMLEQLAKEKALLQINNSDFKALRDKKDFDREKFAKENNQLAVDENDSEPQISECKLLSWTTQKGDTVYRGSIWKYSGKTYAVKGIQRYGNLEMKLVDENVENLRPFEWIPADELFSYGTNLNAQYYLYVGYTEDKPSSPRTLGQLISVSGDVCFCLQTFERQFIRKEKTCWKKTTDEEMTFLFRMYSECRIRALNLGQLDLLRWSLGEACLVYLNNEVTLCHIKDKKQGLICVDEVEDWLTLDKVFNPQPPEWLLNGVHEKARLCWLRFERQTHYLQLASFKNPWDRVFEHPPTMECKAGDVCALIPLERAPTEHIFERRGSNEEKWSFLHVYASCLITDEERRNEILFKPFEDVAYSAKTYVDTVSGEMIHEEALDRESPSCKLIDPKDVAFLHRVKNDEDRAKVVRTPILQHLSKGEKAYLLSDDKFPEVTLEKFEDGCIVVNLEDKRKQVTVDEIVLKYYPSYNFSKEDGRLIYFQEESGQMVCARTVFKASLPESPPRVEPRHDELESWTVVELLKETSESEVDKYLNLHLALLYPQVDRQFVVAVKTCKLKDAKDFYIEAFTPDSSGDGRTVCKAPMEVWMKTKDYYHSLDNNQKKEQGGVINNHFIRIEDTAIVGLILNLSIKERRLFFFSCQLTSELEPGKPIKKFNMERVMVKISEKLYRGTVLRIVKRTVLVVTDDPVDGETHFEVSLVQLFRYDHESYNNYPWDSSTERFYKEYPALIVVEVDEKLILGIKKWCSDPMWEKQQICGVECLHPVDPVDKEVIKGNRFHCIKVMKGDDEKCLFVTSDRIKGSQPEVRFLKEDQADLKAGAFLFKFGDACYYQDQGNELKQINIDVDGVEVENMKIVILALRVDDLQERLKMLTSGQLSGLQFEKDDVIYVKERNTGFPVEDLVRREIAKYADGNVYVRPVDVAIRTSGAVIKEPIKPELIYADDYLKSDPEWLKTADCQNEPLTVYIDNIEVPIREKMEIQTPWEKEPTIVLHLDRNKIDEAADENRTEMLQTARVRHGGDSRFINYIRVNLRCEENDVIQLPKSQVLNSAIVLDSVGGEN